MIIAGIIGIYIWVTLLGWQSLAIICLTIIGMFAVGFAMFGVLGLMKCLLNYFYLKEKGK